MNNENFQKLETVFGTLISKYNRGVELGDFYTSSEILEQISVIQKMLLNWYVKGA